MNSAELAAARRMVGVCVSSLVGGMALALIAAPSAFAAPDCSPEGVAATKNSVTAATQQYLANHPGVNQVLISAAVMPRQQAQATVRTYAEAHPQEAADVKQILTPVLDTQQACNISIVPPNFAWAFKEFMNN